MSGFLLKVETKPPVDHGGSQIVVSNMIMTVPSPQPLLNGNVALTVAKMRTAFGFSVGRNGEDTLGATIDNSNKPAPIPDDLQAAFKTLPAGTAVVLLVKPISLIRVIVGCLVAAHVIAWSVSVAAGCLAVRLSNPISE